MATPEQRPTDNLQAEGGESLEGVADSHASTESSPPASLWSTIAGLFHAPERTLDQVTRHPRLGWAAAVIIVVSIVYGIDASLRWAAGDRWMGVFPAETPPGPVLSAGLVAVPVLFVVLHPLIAGLLRLVARLLGGRGSYRGMLGGYGLALVPSVFVPCGQLPAPLSWLEAVALVWTLWLVVMVVQHNERLSLGRAWTVVAVPVVLPGIVTAITLVARL